jgi:hypothetical protein
MESRLCLGASPRSWAVVEIRPMEAQSDGYTYVEPHAPILTFVVSLIRVDPFGILVVLGN